jgi:hypothetical protein
MTISLLSVHSLTNLGKKIAGLLPQSPNRSITKFRSYISCNLFLIKEFPNTFYALSNSNAWGL